MASRNALREGVAPGGLYTQENIRIMICYLLAGLAGEISKTSLMESLQSTQLANYFEIADALAFLEKTGSVTAAERDGEVYYAVAESGRMVADRLYLELPRSAREKAYDAAFRLYNREQKDLGTDVEISKEENGSYNLTMTVFDEHRNVMLRTTIHTRDYEQAQILSERFRDAPEKLSEAIIDALAT